MTYPVIMHITYCEQGQSIPQICANATRWGFNGIEFRGRMGTGPEQKSYLDEIIASLGRHPLPHILFGSPSADMMLPDPAARAAQVEACIRFYRMAKERLGDRFTLTNAFSGSLRNPDPSIPYASVEKHGSGCATPEHWAWAREGYQAIGDALDALGVRLGFETHPHYLHDTPEVARRLVDQIDRASIGVNLDYGNYVAFPRPEGMAETVARMGRKLHYVHLKNNIRLASGGALRVGLGDGEINTRQFLRVLREAGYAGPICIEAPRQGDREWFAQQDLTYLRSVLADLGR
jgi:sugar phosphate isomerase/epimerase